MRSRPAELRALHASICDGRENLDAAQAARYLRIPPEKIYGLVREKALNPVKLNTLLVFARGDVDRCAREQREFELTKAFMEGKHPLDVYYENDGRFPLREIDRTLKEWAKLTGIWLVEAPRGSYARWLTRMKLDSVSPRLLRRLLEALLTDPEIDRAARAYLQDRRALNGLGAAQRERRARSKLGPRVDAAAPDD